MNASRKWMQRRTKAEAGARAWKARLRSNMFLM